jgi:hypothetical protein
LDELKKFRAERAKQSKTGDNQRSEGVREIASALTGLRSWLDFTIANTTQGRFWDPGGDIRAEISRGLRAATASQPDWETALSSAESVGYKLEEESDRARRDEAEDLRRMQAPKVTKPWKILAFDFWPRLLSASTGSAGLIDLLCHLGIGGVDGGSFLQLDPARRRIVLAHANFWLERFNAPSRGRAGSGGAGVTVFSSAPFNSEEGFTEGVSNWAILRSILYHDDNCALTTSPARTRTSTLPSSYTA